MLSKSRLKYIRSLKYKKYRNEHGQFVVEGDKIVTDLLGHEFIPGKQFMPGEEFLRIDQLIATSGWLATNTLKHIERIREITEVSDREYNQITMLESPSGVMAVLDMPKSRFDKEKVPEDKLSNPPEKYKGMFDELKSKIAG